MRRSRGVLGKTRTESPRYPLEVYRIRMVESIVKSLAERAARLHLLVRRDVEGFHRCQMLWLRIRS